MGETKQTPKLIDDKMGIYYSWQQNQRGAAPRNWTEADHPRERERERERDR